MSQSKLGFDHPSRSKAIIAHRKKRKASMAAPVPMAPVTGKPFQLNQTPYLARLLRAGSRSGGDVLRITGINHYENLQKGPNPDSPEKMFVLTIIDEPYSESELSFADFVAPKNFLVETPDNDVCTLKITGLPDGDDAVMEMFAVGTKIHMFQDGSVLYWLGGPEMENICFLADVSDGGIYLMEKVNDACRYCLKENAERKCALCKVPYCSRECQVADWQIMKHKLVCQDVNVASSELCAISSERQTLEHLETSFASMKLTPSKSKNSEKAQPTRSVLEDPARISQILRFRKTYEFFYKKIAACNLEGLRPIPVKVHDMDIPRNPKPIALKDMKCDSFYWEKAIELTIIDELLLGFSNYVYFLVEDKNKDVTCLTVKGLFRLGDEDEARTRCKQFQVGTRVMVVHPFYKKGLADGIPFIRVEHPDTVKILGMKRDLCRFCGRENATTKCGTCWRLYCGESCQIMDSRILSHASICKVGFFPLSTMCFVARSKLSVITDY